MPLVLMGPRLPRQSSQFLGGTVVLFENLLAECKAHGVDAVVMDTNRRNTRNRAVLTARLAKRIWAVAGPNTTFCLCSSQDWRILLPILQSACAVRGGRVFLRLFGGDFQIRHERRARLTQRAARRLLNGCEAVFVETPPLVDFMTELVDVPVHITVNTRRQTHPPSPRSWSRRVVFVGHVWTAKGIPDLVQAAQTLGPDWHFAVYGPLMEEPFTAEWFAERYVRYGGILEPEQVQPTMDQYDLLVFPTRYPGEGYPGVIIEAMAQNLPVVSSQWRPVPDCVRHEDSGLLFPVQDADALVAALKRIDTEEGLYERLSQGAEQLFQRFTPEAAIEAFLDVMDVPR